MESVAMAKIQLSDQLTVTSYSNKQAPSVGSVTRAQVQLSDQFTYTCYRSEPAPSVGSVAMAEIQLSDHIETSYNNYERALSISMVDNRGYSQSAGESFSYNAPPSLTDVAGCEESYTRPDLMDIDNNWLSLSALIPNNDVSVANGHTYEIPEVYTGNIEKTPAPVVNGQRGRYKRRKYKDSIIKVSGTTEDGYAWRKYGQKEILNSTFPRCYFRCAYKPEYGCKALKQVEKLEDGSNMYHIMYLGHHTCPIPNAGLDLDCKNSKNHQHFPNSLVTIKKINSNLSQKQEYPCNKVSSVSGAQSPALTWEEIMEDLGDALFY